MQNCTLQVQVSSSHFSNGTTGAIVLNNNTAIVSHSTFTSLTHFGHGVAINVGNADGSPFTAVNCTFEDLLARSDDTVNHYGGAIDAFSPRVTILQSRFRNCSAWQGGAVDIFSQQLLNGSWPSQLLVTIDLCMFQSNLANTSGGAVFFFG